MEKVRSLLAGISVFAFIGAAIVPDYIAGVNKAMRLGKAPYPKEKRIKKWTWVGIFILTGIIVGALGVLWETYVM